MFGACRHAACLQRKRLPTVSISNRRADCAPPLIADVDRYLPGKAMASLSSYLPSIVALGTILAVAALITAARPRVRADVSQSRRFLVVAALTIAAQALHFLEELGSGFFVEFPAFFGLPPFTKTAFVVFNVAWIGIWVIALVLVRAGSIFATWPLWFLGLAAVLNLLAHPVLAMRAGAYFPGLFTAPLVGLFGVLLVRELIRLTAEEAAV